MRGQPARLLPREREPARARETGAGVWGGTLQLTRRRIATSALLAPDWPLIGRAPAIAASDWLTPGSEYSEALLLGAGRSPFSPDRGFVTRYEWRGGGHSWYMYICNVKYIRHRKDGNLTDDLIMILAMIHDPYKHNKSVFD